MSWILDKLFKKGREILSGWTKNTTPHKRFPKKESNNEQDVDFVRMKVAKTREAELIERGF